MVAGKDEVGFLERISHVVCGVSGRRNRFDGPAVARYDRAVRKRDVGTETHVARGIEPAGLAEYAAAAPRDAGPLRT